MFDQKTADAIVTGLYEGKTINQIARELGRELPRQTLSDWRKRNKDFADAYEEAMREGCEAIQDEERDIADSLDEDPASRKVRIWQRSQERARKYPEKHGQKLDVKHGGAVGFSLRVRRQSDT